MERSGIMLDKLKSKPWWVQVGLSLILFLVVLFIVLQWAKSYTRHGEKIAVPNLIGKAILLVQEEDNPNDFEYVITDSVYMPEKPGGIILEQDPKPTSFVKNGRKIYVSVSSYDVPKTPYPVKEGYSLRMTKALIENSGFRLGKILERPSDMVESGSFVLESNSNGNPVKFGQLLPKGTRIDLIIAVSSMDSLMDNPVLTGLSLQEAIQLANSKGIETYIRGDLDGDSSDFWVQRQKPDAHFIDKIRVGTRIELTLKLNSEKPVNQESIDE
ncbi:MAG: PASTA domain-containing protein [Crocinitomicaceae bacterium]